MIFDYLEQLLDKLKAFINNSKEVDKARIILILIWLFCVGLMVFTTVGRTILTVFACVCFVYCITEILYIVYKTVEEENNSEKNTQVSESRNKNHCVRKSYGPTVRVVSEGVEINRNESKCGYYPYYVDQIEGNKATEYYILDTSVFFNLQEYTDKRGYCISDIIYENIPMNDNYSYLAEIIRNRRCYVTPEIFEEVKNAEKQYKLQRGVAEFIEEDIGVWKDYEEKFENYSLNIPIDNELEKKPHMKHHKLVWHAVMLSKNRNCDVTIITSSQRIRSLAEANNIKVVNPDEIEQEG